MRRNAITRIVLFSIAIFLLAGILLAGIGASIYMTNGTHKVNTSQTVSQVPEESEGETYTADADSIRDIDIDWAAGSISILPADQSEITIAETGDSDDRYPMIVKESGNKLSIEYCEDATSFIGINRNYEEKHLVIFVPMGWECGSLEINAASASLEISDMSIRKVEFDGASGICSFINCQIDQLSIDTASGDVNFSGTLNELDFDAMSACFHGTLSNIPYRLDMDTMSGDLDIALPEHCGFSLDLDAMSSDFTSDFATTMNDGFHVCGDGACRISVSAMSGDVVLRKHVHTHTDGCYTENSTCPDYSTAHHSDSHH